MSIFDYENVGDFLRDFYSDLKKRNNSFSIRAWAKSLGLADHALLVKVLNDKKKVTPKLQNALLEKLTLPAREERMFELLCEKNRASTTLEKKIISKKLLKFLPKKIENQVEVKDLTPFEDPLLFHILEMVDWPSFNLVPGWVLKNLRYSCSLKRIQKSLDYLVENEFIYKENGAFKKNYPFLCYPKWSREKSINNGHKNLLKITSELIDELKQSERELQGHFFNIKEEDIPKIKERYKNFYKEILNEFDVQGNVTSPIKLVQVSYQMAVLGEPKK